MSGSPQIPKTAKGFYIYPKTYVIGIRCAITRVLPALTDWVRTLTPATVHTRTETDSGERTNRGEEQPTAGTTECVVDSDKETICRSPEDEREELANIQRGLHPVAGKRTEKRM